MEDLSACKEIRVEAPNGSSLCALINGDLGWLMFLRAPGDAGFSSRNPGYVGAPDATISYVLSNGQVDSYPASWALPVATVEQALFFFRRHARPPTYITWHNDANDGSSIPRA